MYIIIVMMKIVCNDVFCYYLEPKDNTKKKNHP